jgi:hypothetical protein
MHIENALVSPKLLVEVNGSQLIRTNVCARCLASPGRAGPGVDEVSVVTSKGAGLCGGRSFHLQSSCIKFKK